MRLVVLNDNEPGPGLLNAWGWSLLVETPTHSILFDTGPSPRILEHNARILGVDLSMVDAVFLSHHHGDHSGGLSYVAGILPGARVYVPPGNTDYLEDMGLTPIVVTSPTPIAEEAWSTGSLQAEGLWEHGLLVFLQGGKAVLVVGCSHPGVDRIAEAATRIAGRGLYMVIGGFHYPSRRALERLAGMARLICPAHCSGASAKRYLEDRYPEKLCLIRTGSILEL